MNLLSGITGKSVIFVFLGVYPIVDNFARTSTLRRKESTPKRQYTYYWIAEGNSATRSE